MRKEGARATQEFISDIRGYRTRWPVLVVASFCAVCVLAFSASRILFANACSTYPPGEETEVKANLNESLPAETTTEIEEHSAGMWDPNKGLISAKKTRRKSMLSFQAEAEAALQEPPELLASKNIARSASWQSPKPRGKSASSVLSRHILPSILVRNR